MIGGVLEIFVLKFSWSFALQPHDWAILQVLFVSHVTCFNSIIAGRKQIKYYKIGYRQSGEELFIYSENV